MLINTVHTNAAHESSVHLKRFLTGVLNENSGQRMCGLCGRTCLKAEKRFKRCLRTQKRLSVSNALLITSMQGNCGWPPLACRKVAFFDDLGNGSTFLAHSHLTFCCKVRPWSFFEQSPPLILQESNVFLPTQKKMRRVKRYHGR